MPIYEYQCLNCNHALEKLQKISDARLTLCPQCNQEQLQRKISAAGFRLKGAGWYETDFKAGAKKNLAGDGGGSSAETTPAGDKASSPAPAGDKTSSPASAPPAASSTPASSA